MTWDVLIRGAKVFDGSGGPAEQVDVAVQGGKVVAKGQGLPAENAVSVEDATGQWLIPGLLDIHTHEDLEVELAPGLPEVVRHGTTSVVAGNCSLGLRRQQPRLAEHFEPVLLPLALLFFIWDDVRILLIAQSVALALGALPVFWIARRQLSNISSLNLQPSTFAWVGLIFAGPLLGLLGGLGLGALLAGLTLTGWSRAIDRLGVAARTIRSGSRALACSCRWPK